jgi:hypothetical protein
VTHRVSSVLLILLSVLLPHSVHAESRLAVQEFRGRHADELRGEVARVLSLQKEVTVVSAREVSAQARALGADLDTAAGRLQVARALRLSAWISGTLKKRHHKLKASIDVHDAAEGARIGHVVVAERSMSRLKETLRDELWERSREAVSLASTPLPEGRGASDDDEQRVARGDDDDDSEDGRLAGATMSSTRNATLAHDDSALMAAPGRRAPDALRAAVGIGSPFRSLAYSDPISENLGDYRLGGAPMVDLGMVYYPGRHVTDGWGSWLGLDVAAQLARGTRSVDRSGNEYESRYSAFRLGVRGRVPVGRHAVSGFSGYSVSKLGIAGVDTEVAAPTPSVDYRMLRSGLGTELTLTSRLAIAVDAAWLHMLSVGQIGQWFPRATASGLELALSASYAVSEHLFARIGASYQRTVFDFNARPGDERAAGGATDQFLTASLGMGVNL